jgi:hypothetical protein
MRTEKERGRTRRDVLRDVAGRDDDLGKGDCRVASISDSSRPGRRERGRRTAVIGQESGGKVLANLHVLIERLRHGVDEPDDDLGDVVAGCSLASEDGKARDETLAVGGRHLLDLEVTEHEAEDVHELPLVSVDSWGEENDKRSKVRKPMERKKREKERKRKRTA